MLQVPSSFDTLFSVSIDNYLLEGLAGLAFQPKVATDMLRMLMNFWLY